MRAQLAEWKGPFEPTNGNLKGLAALLDITLKQCQADYAAAALEPNFPKPAREIELVN